MPPLAKKNILSAILSGVMLTAAFPPGRLDWIIWFALLPLLISLVGRTPSQAFRLGLITGLSHYLTLIYWIIEVLSHYGGLHFLISAGVLLLLCLYLSLFPALFSCLFKNVSGSPFAGFIMACIWTGLEYIRANIFTGFPWCLLGYSQFKHPDLIQIADIGGVYGISFLIVYSNILLFFIFFASSHHKQGLYKLEVPLLSLLIISTLIYGHYQLNDNKTGGKVNRSLRIALIQGNIDQSLKWNHSYQVKTLHKYCNLTRAAYDFKPHLIVWPETSVPFFFRTNRQLADQVINLSKESGADLIFGSPAFESVENRTRYYNRAYLLSPAGELAGYYDKVHLVPFGEYTPLKKLLPFINRLVPAVGDFSSGNRIEPISRPHFSAGILICFEAIFPELARTQTRNGADILVNLTNDAWFGMTSAPFQHLSMVVFRAVENGRPLIRSANTGISAFIDSHGRIITNTGLFTEDALKYELVSGNSAPRFYTCYGDLFAIFLLLICLIKILHIVYNYMLEHKNL